MLADLHLYYSISIVHIICLYKLTVFVRRFDCQLPITPLGLRVEVVYSGSYSVRVSRTLLLLFGLVCVRVPGIADLYLTTRPSRTQKSASISAQGSWVVRSS